MILSERIVVENSILKIANELLQEWGARFKEILIYSDIPFVSRNAGEIESCYKECIGDFSSQ